MEVVTESRLAYSMENECFSTRFPNFSERPPRVSQPLWCTKQKSRIRQRFVDHCLFTHSSVSQSAARWPPSFSTSLPNDRSERSAVSSNRGNDRYRCHLNCVTHWPPNWTGLALPYAQDGGGIAPGAHTSCLTFGPSASWGWGTWDLCDRGYLFRLAGKVRVYR